MRQIVSAIWHMVNGDDGHRQGSLNPFALKAWAQGRAVVRARGASKRVRQILRSAHKFTEKFSVKAAIIPYNRFGIG
jgi:hypothetical protein